MATSTLGSGTLVLAGTTSGTTTVTATAVAGTTTLTLPAATDTLVGKATTDTLTNKTLTGAVMNGTLGATTPSTVAATTLTTSSTVTHNGGTANGVPYLDGSKVLTTGSALVFDGTNFGSAVTPSAWRSNYRALQVGNATGVVGRTDNNNNYFSSNWYVNSSNQDIYQNTGFATLYSQGTGTHAWYNAASGTAGNAITFTQAMTLDASGNLGIATTSPAAKLHINETTTGNNYALVQNTTSGNAGWRAKNADGDWVIIANAALRFYDVTASAERARIDSSGNLLVGTTTVVSPNSGFSLAVGSGSQIAIGHASASSGTYYAYFNYNGSVIGSITQNGTTGVLYNLTSDYRLKNDQQTLTGAKDFIMALKPKKWQWWDGSGEGVGFVAHEFMEVAKYSGHGEKDAVDAEGKPVYQSIQPSSSEVMANLVSFVQEQQALITQLTDRITALESA